MCPIMDILIRHMCIYHNTYKYTVCINMQLVYQLFLNMNMHNLHKRKAAMLVMKKTKSTEELKWDGVCIKCICHLLEGFMLPESESRLC